MKEFLQSKTFTRIVQAIAVLLIALIIFAGGMEVGQRRALFSNRWNNNYDRNFGGPHSVFSPVKGNRDDIFNSHGAVGEIISFQSPNIVIKGPSEVEKSATINSQTIIRQISGVATTSDLQVGKSVVIIGNPDDTGTIRASLIRIMPPAASLPPHAASSLPPANK
jgi:hypothetical protein